MSREQPQQSVCNTFIKLTLQALNKQGDINDIIRDILLLEQRFVGTYGKYSGMPFRRGIDSDYKTLVDEVFTGASDAKRTISDHGTSCLECNNLEDALQKCLDESILKQLEQHYHFCNSASRVIPSHCALFQDMGLSPESARNHAAGNAINGPRVLEEAHPGATTTLGQAIVAAVFSQQLPPDQTASDDKTHITNSSTK